MPQPLFYLLRSNGGTLLSQPGALVLGQAGGQLLEDEAKAYWKEHRAELEQKL